MQDQHGVKEGPEETRMVSSKSLKKIICFLQMLSRSNEDQSAVAETKPEMMAQEGEIKSSTPTSAL